LKIVAVTLHLKAQFAQCAHGDGVFESMRKTIKFLAAALLLMAGTAQAEFVAGGIEITEPWVRITPNGDLEAFFDILNHGEENNSLVSASSPVAEKVVLKQMRIRAMNARADDVSEIKVKASGRTTLKPGQYYLALDGVKSAVAPGMTLPFTLVFAHGEIVDVEARVMNQLLGNRGR